MASRLLRFSDGQWCTCRLELNHYCVDWSAPMFRCSLTRLKVECTAVEVTSHHTVSSIIQVVRELPQLEYLVLDNCVYPAVSSDTLLPTAASRTDLPHLVELRIVAAALPIIHFFDQFVVAPFAKLQITFTDGIPSDLVPPLIRILSSILSTGMTSCARSLEVVYLSKYFCGFSKAKPPTRRAFTPAHLFLHLPPDFTDGQDAFSVNLCSQLFVDDAHLLMLNGDDLLLDYRDPIPWDRLLDKLKNIEKMHVHGNEKPLKAGFADLLSTTNPPSSSDTHPVVVAFPKLKKIRFKHVKIGRSLRQLKRRPEVLGKPSPFVRALRDALVLRKEAGLDVLDLTIKDCIYVWEEDLVHLREVANVKLVGERIPRNPQEEITINQESEDETDEEPGNEQ